MFLYRVITKANCSYICRIRQNSTPSYNASVITNFIVVNSPVDSLAKYVKSSIKISAFASNHLMAEYSLEADFYDLFFFCGQLRVSYLGFLEDLEQDSLNPAPVLMDRIACTINTTSELK